MSKEIVEGETKITALSVALLNGRLQILEFLKNELGWEMAVLSQEELETNEEEEEEEDSSEEETSK